MSEAPAVDLDRTPPISVRRTLRREVGFGCPVRECRSPYLTWHHFDPLWKTEHHHRPEGMIALCREHHDKADNGAYTVAQLRKFKQDAENLQSTVSGRFDWLRQEIVGIGAGLHYNPAEILRYNGESAIRFSRNTDGYLSLDLSLTGIWREATLEMSENFWIADNQALDIDCPPSGRVLRVAGKNGDHISLEFSNLLSPLELTKRHPRGAELINYRRPSFPLTLVELKISARSGEFRVDPTGIYLPRGNYVAGMLTVDNQAALVSFRE